MVGNARNADETARNCWRSLRAEQLGRVRNDAIAAVALGAIERLVGALEDIGDRAVTLAVSSVAIPIEIVTSMLL